MKKLWTKRLKSFSKKENWKYERRRDKYIGEAVCLKAVILAGGKGERLRPLTEKRPKPLVPVGGRMCIEYVINSLSKAGFRKIIVTTGYMSDKLIKEVGDGKRYGASVLYSFEPEPVGTAGAVKKVADFLDDVFVVASGDVLADVDIRALYEFHKKKGAVATMALTEVEDPSEFGVVDLDTNGRVVRFQEKPAPGEAFSNLINAGIYILEKKVLDYIPPDTFFDFSKNVFPLLLEQGEPLYGMKIGGLWRDIGRPGDLLAASLDVVSREGVDYGEGKEENGVRISGRAVISDRAKVEKGAVIRGPVFIGDGVEIGAGSVVEKSLLYPGVKVDQEARIERSIVLDGTYVGWKSVVLGSVVGYNCVLEDDVRIENTILGDGTLVKKHSHMTGANVSVSRPGPLDESGE